MGCTGSGSVGEMGNGGEMGVESGRRIGSGSGSGSEECVQKGGCVEDTLDGGEGEGEEKDDEEAGIRDVEEEVEEAMRRLRGGGDRMDVQVELRDCEMDEDSKVEEWVKKTCGCCKWNGGGMFKAV